MEAQIRKVVEGVSNTRGEDFFQSITLQLASIIHADYTFIAKLDKKRHTSKTIALVAKNNIADNFEYDLDFTPCENVAEDSVCSYPSKVTSLFPKDQLLIDMNIDAYLGTPLHDSNGSVMGLIVALYEHPIDDQESTLTLFQVFSGRIAAEMERVEYENKLQELNQSLEQRVLDRTNDLNQAMSTLKQAQEKLIESEKLASLGNLVAGVAHEVNTPLGVAITAQSVVSEEFKILRDKLENDALTFDDMDKFKSTMDTALPMLESNLQRASNLIINFKKTASDQHHLEIETLHLKDYYEQVLSTVKPLLKKKNITCHLEFDEPVITESYPGIHAQILTNLINNSALHAFTDRQTNNQVTINVKPLDQEHYSFTYSDNGQGLNETQKKNIFEPFYTTARDKGGSGLGMSIIYNLVKQKLQGEIDLLDSNSGFSIRFTLPYSNQTTKIEAKD